MSKIRKLMMVIASLFALSLVAASCTDVQQYAFFVTLGDRVEAEAPRTLQEAGAELQRARSEWTPETATPAQNAVLTELARQAREREQFEAYIRGIEQGRRAIQLHPFLVCVRHHESDRGSYPHINGYGAQNPISTASGAYQFLDSTWRSLAPQAGYGGYPTAAHAPWWVQDAVILYTINHGGRSHWNGTGC